MNAKTQLKPEAGVEFVQDENLLSKVVAATRQTEPDRAQDLLRTLTDQALKGTVVYDRNLTVTLNNAIAELDKTI
jgi:type VI secretion system protein ImpC